MIWPYYALMVAMCSLIAALPFTKVATAPVQLYALGLILALGSNAAWLTVTRIADKAELARLGLIWDGMLTMCYVLVPVLLGARFSLQMGLGMVLIVAGLLVVKGG